MLVNIFKINNSKSSHRDLPISNPSPTLNSQLNPLDFQIQRDTVPKNISHDSNNNFKKENSFRTFVNYPISLGHNNNNNNISSPYYNDSIINTLPKNIALTHQISFNGYAMNENTNGHLKNHTRNQPSNVSNIYSDAIFSNFSTGSHANSDSLTSADCSSFDFYNNNLLFKLIQDINRDRMKCYARYHIFNSVLFETSLYNKLPFNILIRNGINHHTSRVVIHALTRKLKEYLNSDQSYSSNIKQEDRILPFDVFTPSLSQLEDSILKDSKEFLSSLFPYEGCSLKGEELDIIISHQNIKIIINSLKLIWANLPNGLFPWSSYKKFVKKEEETGYPKTSFYQILPFCLPSNDYPYIIQEYLDIILLFCYKNCIGNIDDLNELLYTAAQLFFELPTQNDTNANADTNTNTNTTDKSLNDHPTNSDTDQVDFIPNGSPPIEDIHSNRQLYYIRGRAFQRIFLSYVRNIDYDNSNFKNDLSISFLNDIPLNPYPPVPFVSPHKEMGLVLSIPSDYIESNNYTTELNYKNLIQNVVSCNCKIYSSQTIFRNEEQHFIDKLIENPFSAFKSFVSLISLKYLSKFDPSILYLENSSRKNNDGSNIKSMNGVYHHLNSNQNSYQLYSVDEFLNSTIGAHNINTDDTHIRKSPKIQPERYEIEENPIKVSKIEVNEWLVNTWKLETQLKKLKATIFAKFKSPIGHCQWLILCVDERRLKENPCSLDLNQGNHEEKSEYGKDTENNNDQSLINNERNFENRSIVENKNEERPVLEVNNDFQNNEDTDEDDYEQSNAELCQASEKISISRPENAPIIVSSQNNSIYSKSAKLRNSLDNLSNKSLTPSFPMINVDINQSLVQSLDADNYPYEMKYYVNSNSSNVEFLDSRSQNNQAKANHNNRDFSNSSIPGNRHAFQMFALPRLVSTVEPLNIHKNIISSKEDII
ncbi:uncharacterized protein ASCRUDRAFT_13009 [Ascoidea rubescens DSM 1968]|uniref:Meiotically up-regulated protein Msb1/Mug8 domain-containing protein n=1 Tax=Ascoidea rubescens DSM 1968 TaxID=1344418 RepID=A0A1D2VI82_9ASCO|nr:hypothetical protein ASCRUDRAFT_13009 [Ascoidea rubescens DSM 1968]ODV61319.1 hypothetical protein ASCRUDRAFT_13009 [Ascoidea rubescens DSM 1968]